MRHVTPCAGTHTARHRLPQRRSPGAGFPFWLRHAAWLSVLVGASAVHGLSPLYEYSLIAREGMATVEGDPLIGIGPEVSVNEGGWVAFVARMDPGSNLIVGQSTNDLRNISRSHDARNFGFPQINNQNVVVTRELLGGRSVVHTWRATNPGDHTVIASTALSQFTQLTIPTLGNTERASDPPLVGFLGRVSDLEFAYYANTTGQRNTQEEVSPLAGRTLTSFRAMTAHSQRLTFVAQFSTAADRGRVVVFQDELLGWTDRALANTERPEWHWVGTAPGISDSGQVVAFSGETATQGEGIFLAYSTDWLGAGHTLAQVIGSNNPIAYDASAAPITLTAFDKINRVGVLHQELGRPGLADDVVTLAFLATPSKASRLNPHLPGSPLLFTDQPGLWTLRVNFETDGDAPHTLTNRAATPVAVVQVGDRIDGAIVKSLALYDPLSLALADKRGAHRAPGPGDHFVAFSAATDAGVKVVRAGRLDADGDGLMDFWEQYGIDLDRDGAPELKLPEWGAHPLRKDLFVEIDWLTPRRGPNNPNWTNAPAPGATARFAQMFAEAPVANPDGTTGIQLHVDAGPGRDPAGAPYSVNAAVRRGALDGGNEIGLPGDPAGHPDVVFIGLTNQYNLAGVAIRSLDSIKDEFFGARDKGVREFVFKYVVLADFSDYFRSPTTGGVYQRNVAAATADSVTTAMALPATLDNGQLVLVISGRGAGQIRGIRGFPTAQSMRLRQPWTVVPDNTSRLTFLSGSSGRAEVIFQSGPSWHARPGNDYLVTLGGFGVNAGGWLATQGELWRTLAHELGHTLGLRHGGLNHTNYKTNYLSIMNYRYTWTRSDYSGATDPVFNDWAYLRFDFQNTGYILGNAFGFQPLWAGAPDLTDPTIADYEQWVGHPLDLVLPQLSITSPVAGAAVAPGGTLNVALVATDNAGLAAVTVDFDTDGDGQTVGATEILSASPGPGGTYTASFRDVTGPLGVRRVRALATDTSGNQRAATVSVQAGDSASTGSTLDTRSAGFAAQPAASAGGSRQRVRLGPVHLPGSGQVMLSLVATPPIAASGGGVTRSNAAISRIEFEGDERLDWTVADLANAERSLANAYWSAPATGALYLELLGPASQDAAGAFLGGPAQNYTLTVTFRPVDRTPPQASVVRPPPSGFVGLGETLEVRVNVTDDYGVASVTIGFDANGDGDTRDAGETLSGALESPGLYRASFPAVGGDAGTRPVRVVATDTAGFTTDAVVLVEVRAPDLVLPTVRITAPTAGTAVARGSALSVQAEAGDDVGLGFVTVAFDLDGNGTIAGPAETPAATQSGPFTFQATFDPVSGPSGPRSIWVRAVDTSGNTNLASVPITVGGVAPVVEMLFTQTGSIAGQRSQWVGGRRQVVEFEPLTLPSAGTVTFTVTSTPNCRQTNPNLARYDPVVDRVNLNGKDWTPTQSWNSPGSNPAIGTSTFIATAGGALDFRILGAAVYNTWGEFDGSPAQSYTLEVRFESIDNVDPAVTVHAPIRGTDAPLGQPLEVDLTVTDNVEVASVLGFLDLNGDQDTADLGETLAATSRAAGQYRIAFPALTGPPGRRVLGILATDTSLNTTDTSVGLGAGGVGAEERVLFSASGVISNLSARQTLQFSPLNVPGVGRLEFRVVATPNTRQVVQNLTRHDPTVSTLRFNGQPILLTPECNPPGSDPAVCTSVWDSPGPGPLTFEVLGPATYNSWGEFTGHPQQQYSVQVLFVPGPTVTHVEPATASIAGGDVVTVKGAGFAMNAMVLFAEIPASGVTWIGPGELACRVPPGTPGAATVTVLNDDPEGRPWNYGVPYGLFGRLTNGFAYVVPAAPVLRDGERLLTTYRGYFAAVDAEAPQRQETYAFTIPGEGRLRFETWAFVPILSPIPGPFEAPDDLAYHNESAAVHGFVAGDGGAYGTVLESTDLSYPYGAVISQGTASVGSRAAGTGRFTVKGPARWNAFWRQFGEFEMVSAPAQNYSVAVWFARPPLVILELTPSTAPGQPVRIRIATASGKAYRLERVLELAPGVDWQAVGPAVSGTGGVQVLSDPAPPLGARQVFYRVVELP